MTAWDTTWQALGVMELGPDGRLYVVDAFGNLLTVYDTDGSELGTIEYESSVPPELSLQNDIAIGPDGRLYLLEATAGARVLVYEPDGTLVAEWGGTFPSDPFAEESLFDAQSIAVAPDGHVFIAKLGGRLQKFTSDGEFVTVWDRAGDYLLPAEVYDMDVADGVLYVAAGGYRDDQSVIMMFDFDGNLVAEPIVVGEGDIEGRIFPASLAIGPDGNMFIADPFNREIIVMSPTGDELGRWSLEATEERFPNVEVEVDEAGLVYVADDGRKEIVVYAPEQAD
ncbi:MAG TPA: NHL repeat-containing protein [Thermomicrobiales bacterium]|nr:NHL repeat-containing protein [Thermomicrobiales bacterium]